MVSLRLFISSQRVLSCSVRNGGKGHVLSEVSHSRVPFIAARPVIQRALSSAYARWKNDSSCEKSVN
jgi:hypothetical protein